MGPPADLLINPKLDRTRPYGDTERAIFYAAGQYGVNAAALGNLIWAASNREEFLSTPIEAPVAFGAIPNSAHRFSITGKPLTSTSAWIFVVSPPRERPMHSARASFRAVAGVACGPPF